MEETVKMYYRPAWYGFSQPPNKELLFVEIEGLLCLTIIDAFGISNSSKLEFTVPYPPVEDYTCVVYVKNNGILEQAALIILANTLTAKVFLTSGDVFNVSGEKGISFCLIYKPLKYGN